MAEAVTFLNASFVPIGSSAYDWQTLFASYKWDTETQLYLVRNRFYHTPLGTWLTRDPAGYVDVMNLYEYVMSRPIGFVDPMGLESCAFGIGGTNEDELQPANTVRLFDRILHRGSFIRGIGSDFNGRNILKEFNFWRMSGANIQHIVQEALDKSCKMICEKKCTSVILYGWSRGAAAAIDVAARLRQGCCCDHDKQPKECAERDVWLTTPDFPIGGSVNTSNRGRMGGIVRGGTKNSRLSNRSFHYRGFKCDKWIGNIPVQWMGLFDPVSMSAWQRQGGTIPDNVREVSVARDTMGAATSKSEAIFPPLNITAMNPNTTNVNVQEYFLGHGGVGNSDSTLQWMINQGTSAGVNIGGM